MSHLSLEPGKGFPSRLLWLLTTIAGFSVANIYYIQPLMDMIRVDLQLSVLDVNTMVMLTQIGYASGLLFIIPLGDLYHRKSIILYNLSILVVTLLAIGYSRSYEVMLLSSFVTGLCSVTPQIFIPIAAIYSRPENKAKNVGIVLSGLLTGILLSRVISGIIGEYLGWSQMYLIASGFMVACILCIYKMLPDIPPTFKGKYLSLMKSLWALIRDYPSLRIYSTRSALAFGSFLAMWACMAFKIKGAPFYAGSDVVGLLGLCGIVGVMTASSAGQYIKRIGVRKFHFIGCGFHLAAWASLYWGANSYIGLIAGIILIDIGMQCIQLSNQSSIFSLCPSASNRVNTIFMTTYFVGGSLGTFMAGLAWQWIGWTGVVWSGTLLILGSLLIACLSKD